eukprot:766973-Hanusia_phi.AAC.9
MKEVFRHVCDGMQPNYGFSSQFVIESVVKPCYALPIETLQASSSDVLSPCHLPPSLSPSFPPSSLLPPPRALPIGIRRLKTTLQEIYGNGELLDLEFLSKK